jgi:hypothetical protein
MEDLKQYLDYNYGQCNRALEGHSCSCLKNGWIGTGCFSWKPFNVSTYEELREAQKNLAPVAQRLELGAHNA